ncbi:Bromo adjacent y [Desmophyllum pertusum]|uniref:Bromo adjacent y n=1 Tax=Desmophyllum pertusum TaxID=174260 RepID=A0A9X0A2T0_9CNID|nr:Bromo adjacent y [Desmophyllum pertusum]
MEIQERHTVGNTTDNAALFESEKDVTEHKRTRRSRTRHTSMLERLAPTPGYVDKTSMDLEGGSLAQRRTPRMASLNAAAKVNVFFEPSSPLAGRSLFEIQQHSAKKIPSGRHSTERRLSDRSNTAYGAENRYDREDYTETDVFVQSEVTSTWDPPRSTGVIVSPRGVPTPLTENAANSFEFVTNGHRAANKQHKRKPEADSTSEGERKAKRIHLDGTSEPHAILDRDEILGFEDCQGAYEIECDTTTDSEPKTMVDVCIQVDLPRPQLKHVRVLSVPIKGQLVTSSCSVPFTKSHLVTPVTPSRPPPELKMSKTATTKRAAGLNNLAMENTFTANDGPLAKFKAVGGLMDERSKARKAKELVNKIPDSSSSVKLKIPKINFAATSTSTMSAGRSRPAGNPLKSIQLKNLNIHLEKLAAERARAEPRQPKRTNGWMFTGEPLDKPYCYDETIVIRRYYSGIQRGDEIINVRDSVLLKSGTRKKDPSFVARVSGLWEEDEGPNAGEMMMSVFWYYRPEQTEVGRIPNFHGEMEVMASRHKDDNSVACIVDKCYVLSYPEYCRFRALNRLFREFREAPLSPVPPGRVQNPAQYPILVLIPIWYSSAGKCTITVWVGSSKTPCDINPGLDFEPPGDRSEAVEAVNYNKLH